MSRLVAPVAALVARDDLHPAIQSLLVEAVKEVHGGAGMFHRLGDFPRALDPEFDVTDDVVNPLGVKGVGEIGQVGVAAAIANAVFHATGRRIRELPLAAELVMDPA